MEKVMLAVEWLKVNWSGIAAVLSALIIFLEAVVKVIPTSSPEGALTRIGKGLDWLMALARIPNIQKIQTFEKKDVK